MSALDASVEAPRRGPRVWFRRALVGAILLVLAVEFVVAAPYIARGATSIESADLRWLIIAVAAELISMRAFARLRRRMLAAGGQRVSLRRIEALTYTSTAVGTTFPGGSAVSSGYLFKRLLTWGVTVPAAGFTVLASSVLSVTAFGALAVVSAVVLGHGGLGSLLTLALTALAVVIALAFVRHLRRGGTVEHIVRRVNRWLHRTPDAGLDTVLRFGDDLRAIRPRGRDWAVGLGLAELNWVMDLGCLLACCQAVDATRSSIALVMVAYVAGMSVSTVTFSPGGLGIIDAAMIFALTQGGETMVVATAAVLLYRLISFALVAAVGWSVWLGGFLHRRGLRVPAVNGVEAVTAVAGSEPATDPGPALLPGPAAEPA